MGGQTKAWWAIWCPTSSADIPNRISIWKKNNNSIDVISNPTKKDDRFQKFICFKNFRPTSRQISNVASLELFEFRIELIYFKLSLLLIFCMIILTNLSFFLRQPNIILYNFIEHIFFKNDLNQIYLFFPSQKCPR